MFSLSRRVATLSAVVAIISVFLLATNVVLAQSFVNAGNELLIANVTKATGWSQTQTADPGNIVEFRMLAQNKDPNTTINNVVVKGIMPGGQSKTLVVQATVTADNAQPITESGTINVSGPLPQRINIASGHAVLINKNCPNGCSIPDSQITNGVMVGNLGYNEWAQVIWKAMLTNIVPASSPSPSPSPSPTPSPSPSPVVSPSPSVAPNLIVQCADGSLITVLAGQNANLLCQQQQQSQTQNNNQSVNVGGTTVNLTNSQTATNPASPAVIGASTSAVSELPKTGLPLAGLALTGLAPIGLKLRRFTRKDEEGLTPSFIWQEREFKKG